MASCLDQAMNCDYLRSSLENISEDDKRSLESYTEAEIVAEAKWVLSEFYEGGHSYNDDLQGENGAFCKKEAQKGVRQLKALIKKFDK